jgi:hypothetical protein
VKLWVSFVVIGVQADMASASAAKATPWTATAALRRASACFRIITEVLLTRRP